MNYQAPTEEHPEPIGYRVTAEWGFVAPLDALGLDVPPFESQG